MNTENFSFMDPFNCLVSLKEGILGFVNSILETEGTVELGLSISVGLVEPLVDDRTEAYFNSNMVRRLLK